MTKYAIFFLVFTFASAGAQQAQFAEPPPLKKGDTVGIVAPARHVSASSLEPAIALLESWGLHVKLGGYIYRKQNQLAGADWQRATDIQKMFDAPGIKAIWAAKGGYGTARIVDRIDFSGVKKHPKWFIGFSDATVMHSHLQRHGLQSIHGLVAISARNASVEAKESLRAALFGLPLSYEVSGHTLNQEGSASGVLVGGNLSVLYSIMGSPSAVDWSGKILFLEDLDEYVYHIDRMMLNLKRSGQLAKLKGVVVGGMTKMRDNDEPWGQSAEGIIAEHLSGYNVPVMFGFPAGHIRDNRTLVLGAKVRMTVKKDRATLVFE